MKEKEKSNDENVRHEIKQTNYMKSYILFAMYALPVILLALYIYITYDRKTATGLTDLLVFTQLCILFYLAYIASLLRKILIRKENKTFIL